MEGFLPSYALPASSKQAPRRQRGLLSQPDVQRAGRDLAHGVCTSQSAGPSGKEAAGFDAQDAAIILSGPAKEASKSAAVGSATGNGRGKAESAIMDNALVIKGS